MPVRTKNERVVFIEYQDGRPSSVTTRDDDSEYYYYVDFCKRDGQSYYHQCGSGRIGDDPVEVASGATYWAASDVPVDAKEGAILRKRAIGRKGFEVALAWGWSAGFSESETEYCPECDDYLPSEDVSNWLCDHCWWCDETGWWSKPGERCSWDCEYCLREGHEVTAPPPMVRIAGGYGRAASELATVAREILACRGLDAKRLVRRMGWCDEGFRSVEMALRGEVDPDVEPRHIRSVGAALDLSDAGIERLLRIYFR